MNDLMCLAFLRRILVEEGVDVPAMDTTAFDWLEWWMRVPSVELNGISPLSAWRNTDQAEAIRRSLLRAAQQTGHRRTRELDEE